jgi:two-component system OmpR family sensor kinase
MAGKSLNYSGFVVAGAGFFLTRFTVTVAIYEDPVRFYLAGVVPLVLGLGLAAFGVALAVADVDRPLVRTTALWCLVGLGTMLGLVVLTLSGSSPDDATLEAIRSQAYLSNFLIGGSVGGTLTGLYAARNRRQRTELEQQANRLVTLNRILRDEVLNSVSAIRGYTQVDRTTSPDPMTVIDEQSRAIQQTIEEVKYLTRRTRGGTGAGVPIDLETCLAESVETVTDRHPEASVSVESLPEGAAVRANERLSQVFTHLLENAVVHGDDDTPRVAVTATRSTVAVSVTDDGPGLPETQQALLERGDITEFDDPTTGFGLNIVRLLVESSGGTVEADAGAAGTTVTVTLPRSDTSVPGAGPNRRDLTAVRPALPHLVVAFVAAVLAGVPYGIASELLGGSVAGIGVFYGATDLVVGWLTHEFHSVVFGFVYVGLLSVVLERYRDTVATYVAVGVAWALTLWVVAAGIIAPIWLRLLGISAAIPNVSVPLLVSHLAWGISLSLLTAWGYTYVAPRLDDTLSRVER